MSNLVKELWENSDEIQIIWPCTGSPVSVSAETLETFAKLIVEETLKEVDERTFCRGETSWYDDDKKWVRLHFGYGELK